MSVAGNYSFAGDEGLVVFLEAAQFLYLEAVLYEKEIAAEAPENPSFCFVRYNVQGKGRHKGG